ncbi:hypothetical protein GCM10027456_02130 [Kineosporia babensis]
MDVACPGSVFKYYWVLIGLVAAGVSGGVHGPGVRVDGLPDRVRLANLPNIMGILSATALTSGSARSAVPAHLGHVHHRHAHHGVHISPVGAGSY